MKKLLFLFLLPALLSCNKTKEQEYELVKDLQYNFEIVNLKPLSGKQEHIKLYNIKSFIEERRFIPDSLLGKLIFVNTDRIEGTKDSIAIKLDSLELDSLFIYSSKLFNEHNLTNVDTAVNGKVIKPYTTDFGMVSIKIYKEPVSKELQFFNLVSLDQRTRENYSQLFRFIRKFNN